MILSKLAQDLYEEISELSIIDAHEHLVAEEDYLALNYSGLNMFAGYIWRDLASAGLSPEFVATMRDGGDQPVEEWWPIIKPYWEYVKNGSYARALRITAKDIFGIEEIDDNTIHVLAEKVKAYNKPGLYHKILQERCNIRYSITCVDNVAFPNDPGLRGLAGLIMTSGTGRDMINQLSEKTNIRIKDVDDVAEALRAGLCSYLKEGAIGFKMRVGDYRTPDPAAAEEEVKRALDRSKEAAPCPALRTYLFDKLFDIAAQADVPVAVHTGYWGDFREVDPKLMFSFAMRREDVRFDMFHLGMPMIRDAILIGKTLPNVTLNLTWCPIISQLQTVRSLNEIIDLVPVNKIIAFGGDYRVCVQKVYGHLVMAREVLAIVLAARIEARDFDKEYAMHLAKLWFHDNPCRIYHLS